MTNKSVDKLLLSNSAPRRRGGYCRRRSQALLAIGLSWLLTACAGAPVYTAAPFSGQVIDRETKQPIGGAVVMASWRLVTGSLDGERYIGQLETKETVTDENGRFSFEGFARVNPGLGELRDDDPWVLFFKGGYQHKAYGNNYPGAGTQTPGSYRKAWVDGRVIELVRLVPAIAPWNPNLITLHGLLNSLTLEQIVHDCQWHKIPRLFKAMDDENQRLKALYPKASIGIGIDDFTRYSRPECKLTRETLQGYLK